ncbi:septum site-determining protein Ssd [Geodermatophilus ruber]|uniref:Helicase/secretion neighborhood CpaE-like protein n=1 Tax=Geodermatophilus ruber TaxID=504800 RepID=A0A1I4DAT3_9ACTN|nr:septum site-determining protein Ssd [Geodermatophilus ruber]SFK89236.1 helicase/secretion neighborhood CpaE-like protein [Geodermatophilus ruber]
MSARLAPPARPLLVGTDEDLLDDLLRLLAAAGAEAEVATGGPALRRAHREAPLVLLGADGLSSAAVRALPRRPGVVVVTPCELSAADWAAAVELGAERVAVLPADEEWLVSRVAAALRRPVDRGWLVAVAGSCGGAGASTVAAALALTAAPDAGGVLLLDADGWGAGLDLVLGLERADGLRWPELAGLRGRVAGDAVMAALPEAGGVSLLAASRAAPSAVPAEALTAVVEAARAGGRPVVVDLPRAADPGTAELVLAEADLVVLLVPGRIRAASAARLLVEPGPGGQPSPWAAAQLVVRRVAAGLSAEEVADVVGRPVLADLGHDRSAVSRGERGELPLVTARSPLGGLARRILAELPLRAGAAA